MTKKETWRVIGDHPAGKLIGYYLDGVKQCTFVGRFDCQNKFDLRLDSREYYGTVPKTRVIYLADLEKAK
jgi:hypothetical protein